MGCGRRSGGVPPRRLLGRLILLPHVKMPAKDDLPHLRNAREVARQPALIRTPLRTSGRAFGTKRPNLLLTTNLPSSNGKPHKRIKYLNLIQENENDWLVLTRNRSSHIIEQVPQKPFSNRLILDKLLSCTSIKSIWKSHEFEVDSLICIGSKSSFNI